MSLFKCRKKEIEAQRWILKLVNNHCPELLEHQEGPRLETRVALTVPAWIVPLEGKMPALARAFAVVTKEFSPSGISLVINRPFAADEVLAGFQWQEEKKFLRGKVRHIDSMGAGFSQLGLQVTEVVCLTDYPELDMLDF